MELLTVHEIAERLRVSPMTVRRYIAAGRLPAVKVGKGVRVRREALDQFATPIEPKAESGVAASGPMTVEDPMTKLIGTAHDAPSTDASRKHEYLAEALAPKPL